MQKGRKRSDGLFVVVKGEGFLEGTIVWKSLSRDDLLKESLLYQKVLGARGALMASYPFNEETWKACVNYDEHLPVDF